MQTQNQATQNQIQHLQEMLTTQNGQGSGSKDPQIHFGTYTPRFGGGETSYQDGNSSGKGAFKAKTIRLDFPRLDEKDPETWTCRAE
jgi:hypothetical protein